MKDYLNIRMTPQEISAISNLGLAHIGDCVYDMLVRSYIIVHGDLTNAGIHRKTVEMICARAQARAMETLLPLLSEEEAAVYRRGRNTRVNSMPKNAEPGDYHAATGLECLFGWLYLSGRRDRINELFAAVVDDGQNPEA